MKLKIKKEFLDFSIQTSTMRKTKLSNLPESKYFDLYYNGYSVFFDVIEKKKEIIEANDDFNNEK